MARLDLRGTTSLRFVFHSAGKVLFWARVMAGIRTVIVAMVASTNLPRLPTLPYNVQVTPMAALAKLFTNTLNLVQALDCGTKVRSSFQLSTYTSCLIPHVPPRIHHRKTSSHTSPPSCAATTDGCRRPWSTKPHTRCASTTRSSTRASTSGRRRTSARTAR